MWLIWKVHKETSELFIQTAQFVFRGKSRSCRPRALDWNTHNAPRLGMFFVYSYFEKGCRKKLHATIPKGNMGYDQYTVPNTVAIEPTFVAFLKHSQAYGHGLSCHCFKLLSFSEEQWTQNNPQYLSGLSRALFPTTFLEIAVNYNWDELLDLDIYLSFQTSTRTGAVQLLQSWTKVLRHICFCESFC